jgi:glycosyltransferase involved in cell wall biosynthesis
MKVLFIARSTLYKDRGGDTVQVLETAEHLRRLGIDVTVKLTSEAIDYEPYDLLHFFNIIRPADILHHIRASGKPYVVSTIYVDYSEYEKTSRKGFAGLLFRLLSSDRIEYLKVVARRVIAGEKIVSPVYLWYGQRGSIRRIIRGAAMLLPNSASEYRRLLRHYKREAPFEVIPNAIDPGLFRASDARVARADDLVLCVGRIEGRKNQLNLIRALNGTPYRLYIIGSASANQAAYYKACKEEAGPNVQFINGITQKELTGYYSTAKVHVLPSWFETTGLSSLEAAAMGCTLVITDKGDTREYFEDFAVYCDPASVTSIRAAVEKAAAAKWDDSLQRKIFSEYTWEQTARRTAMAYSKVLPSKFPEKSLTLGAD